MKTGTIKMTMSVPMQIKPTIDRFVADYGQYLQGVFGETKDERPFVYTIGNALVGLPELIIYGFDPRSCAPILNELWQEMRLVGKPIPVGVMQHHNYHFPFLIHNCSDEVKKTYTIQAGQYLGREDYTVQQIVLSDKDGKLPGMEGINPIFDVPLF